MAILKRKIHGNNNGTPRSDTVSGSAGDKERNERNNWWRFGNIVSLGFMALSADISRNSEERLEYVRTCEAREEVQTP